VRAVSDFGGIGTVTSRGHRWDERDPQSGSYQGLNCFQLSASKTDVVTQIVPVTKAQYLIAKTVAFVHDDEPVTGD